MKRPLVTVLMPNHNGERFIARCIRSVLAQTFTDYELLIVEDASTDGSVREIEQFDDPRIRLVRLERNEHICVALNTGLSQARGKYIARIDSDDCWYPEKLEKQVAWMQAHPECGACFTWVNVVDEQDRRLGPEESFFVDLFRKENRPRRQWVHDFFLYGSCLCHPSAVFPLQVVRDLGGYRNSLVQTQDFDLWIRIAKRYELHILEQPLMDYRHALQGGNVSAISPAVNIRSYYEMSSILGGYFDDLTDEEFQAVFREEFTRRQASSPEQLQCEKALLLLRPVFCGHAAKLRGMDLLAKLLDDEGTRRILRDEYDITQLNFYQLSSSNALIMEEPGDVFYQLESTGIMNVLVQGQMLKMISWTTVIKVAVRKVLVHFPRLYKQAEKIYARARRAVRENS